MAIVEFYLEGNAIPKVGVIQTHTPVLVSTLFHLLGHSPHYFPISINSSMVPQPLSKASLVPIFLLESPNNSYKQFGKDITFHLPLSFIGIPFNLAHMLPLSPPSPLPPPPPPLFVSPSDNSPPHAAALPTTIPSSASASTRATPARQAELTPLEQIVIQNRATKPHTPLLNPSHIDSSTYRKSQLLQQARPRQTNPVIWCFAFLCLAFSLLLIFLGIATLIVYLVVRPRNLVFDIPNASLSTIYFDAPESLNGDVTILANFTNPNRRVDVRYENADIELFFGNRLIATQAIQPFSQRKREVRLQPIHLLSSLVYLPQNSGFILRRQVQSNKVIYNIRGTFKVRASLGIIHYSYWLHSRCQLVMTSPPTGVLVARSCKTKR